MHPFKLAFLILAIQLSSCTSEPIGKAQINLNIVDEELYDLIGRVTENETETSIDCIEFNYPLVLFVFDENDVYIEVISIRGDQEFSAFLEQLDSDYSISLSFPILGTLNNGEVVEITTNEELKEAIDACRADELLRRCNGTLIDCIWKVGELEGHPNQYEGAYYKLRYDGTVQFHYNDDVFFGTWVTLIIGADVFLNIDLNDNAQIEDFWDINWLVDLRNDERIEISHDATQVLIEKDCSIPCVAEGYQVCEFEDNPGFANFIFQNYTPCISVPSTHDVVSAVTYSFYETKEDALLGVNSVSATGYVNTSNPQTIYVRIVYKETGELLRLTEITVVAITCPEG